MFVITSHPCTHATEGNGKTYAEFGMDHNLSGDSVT